MKEYNYADEIVKDMDNSLPAKRYVRYYGDFGEDIFNTDYNKSIFYTDISLFENDKILSNKKMASFQEGLKNDNNFL